MDTRTQQHILDQLQALAERSNVTLRDRVYSRGNCLGMYTQPPTPEDEDVDPYFPVARGENPMKPPRAGDKATTDCATCPVRLECLELELRVGGQDTAGIWGGLCELDRIELHPAWLAYRAETEPELAKAG